MADETTTVTAPPAAPKKSKAPRILLGFVPTTPVPFTGKEALLAYGRVAAYGGVAWLTFNKNRKVSYTFMGLAAVCIATSLSSHLWGK